MAVIRAIEAGQGLDSGAGSRPSTRIDDSIGDGLKALGGAVGNLAEARQSIELRQQQMAFQNAEFQAEQDFQRFQQDQAAFAADQAVNIDPSGVGYAEKVSTDYTARSEQFMKQVPEAIRPRMAELLRTHRNDVLNVAAAKEADQRQTWFREGVTKQSDQLAGQVVQNPAAFDKALGEGQRLIDASGLPPKEKAALKDGLKQSLLLAKAENYKRTDPSKITGAAGGAGIASGDARDLIRDKEGFRAKPYWDVDAWRIGYGSDTITTGDGRVKRVAQGDVVTQADAERDLLRRSRQFEQVAAGQVSTDAWARLPGAARSALISVAYNYGELPGSVVRAVRSGDLNAIADSVAGLQGHNGGINRQRRLQEAQIIRTGQDDGTPALTLSDEFRDLSTENRLKLYDQALAAQRDIDAAGAARAKAEYEAMKDTLDLGIETGQVASRQQILESGLSDGDKALMLRRLGEKGTEEQSVAEFMGRVEAGQGHVNPFDDAERKVAEKAFTKAMESVAPDKAGAFERAFIAGTGYVPKAVMADLQAGAVAREPAAFAEAMQRADTMERVAPAAFAAAEGGGAVLKQLEPFRAYVSRYGLSPEEAAKRVLAATDPASKATREQLKPALDKVLKGVTVADVADLFDPGAWSYGPGEPVGPGQSNVMTAEYREFLEDAFYEANGDQTSAEAIAKAEMKKRWGVSEISGNSAVMRLPPESFYPAVSGSHVYLRDDALKAATDFVAVAHPGRQVENIALVPDGLTEQDIALGQPPRYRLFYQFTDADGLKRYDEVSSGRWGMDGAMLGEKVKVGGSARQDFMDMRSEARFQPDGGRAASLDAFVNGPQATPDMPQGAVRPKPAPTTPGGRIAETVPNVDPALVDMLNNSTGN